MAQAGMEAREYLERETVVDADFHLTHPHHPAVREDWAEYLEDPYRGMALNRSIHDDVTPKDTYPRGFARPEPDGRAESEFLGLGSAPIREAGDVASICDSLGVDHPILNVLSPLGAVNQTDFALALMRGFNDYLLGRFLDANDDFYGLATLAPQRPDLVAEE